MADNVIVPRSVRMQIAAQKVASSDLNRAELEEMATDLRLDVQGTGSGGSVTKDDLRGAILGQYVAPSPTTTTTAGGTEA